MPFAPCMLLTMVASLAASPGASDGWRPLFNGRDLDGWWGCGTEDPASWMALAPEMLAARQAESRADIAAHWRVERGELVNDGEGLYLTTNENFGDFELALAYRTVAGADSGVYLRGIPQVQIWDTTEAGGKWSIGADRGSGGLWNNAPDARGRDPLVLADRPFGEWNDLRVLMVGERVTVHLNGRLVVDHARLENYFRRAEPIPARGPIQLQTHGGEIRWRDVRVREIGAPEANRILGAHDDDGFLPLMNGHDLDGWDGARDGYEAVDGTIRCRAGHGGALHTVRSFGDFRVRLEVRIPPGGNNGLAIRYPGTGDPAYAGMCELQVLDDDDPRYATLDPRQYFGSAYGMVPAHRGRLRPDGEWNFEEVVVTGSRIRVELNGTRILDADLAEVTSFLHDPATFVGRGRTEGSFGFAGHSDPVAYRNVRILELSPR